MLNEFDHRFLGEKYELFSFFEEGPGFPVWHEAGLRIKNALINFWRKIHIEYGYKEIQSPIMLDKDLWRKSGHCDYFEENMFFSQVDKRDYAIKPMNCPGAILVFNQKKRSHKELPLRLCELGLVHRYENSGSLHGLMRVRSFVQDDAHIFCSEGDLLIEIKSVIKIIQQVMQKCELKDYHFELSLKEKGVKNYLGSDEDWKLAENKLEVALIELNLPVNKQFGGAKFYGPSLDLHIKDRHGRSWQCSSIQLDFNLPARFNLCYFDQQGERKVPFMLHRAIFGSLERFIGILLENFGKNLPFWMHPHHYKILSISKESNEYANEVFQSLYQRGYFVQKDLGKDPLKEKIRRAYDEMFSEVVIVGNKEAVQRSVIIKKMNSENQQEFKFEEFLKLLTQV